jgi:hypothetical protein
VLIVADAVITMPKVFDQTPNVAALRWFFNDAHVHAALIVEQGILIRVIERSDLDPSMPDNMPASRLASQCGRTIAPDVPLEVARRRMLASEQRRLAVVDDNGFLLGLLCLKSTGSGFCSDDDVQARAADPR